MWGPMPAAAAGSGPPRTSMCAATAGRRATRCALLLHAGASRQLWVMREVEERVKWSQVRLESAT